MRFIKLTSSANGTPLYIAANAIGAVCQSSSSHIASNITEVHTQTEIFFVHESVEDIIEQIKQASYPPGYIT